MTIIGLKRLRKVLHIPSLNIVLVFLPAAMLGATSVVAGESQSGDRESGDVNQSANQQTPDRLAEYRPNFKAPTLGGTQFWSDELFFHKWHIQKNVLTGHYRLLDDQNHRRAWGTFKHCEKALMRAKRELKMEPMRGKAVIVLHGLFRTHSSMNQIANYLEQQGKYAVFNATYASTRGGVGTHAESLARIIRNLHGIEEINFVAHSLGNIVIRHYLADHTNPGRGLKPDPRISRIVMLGPPNQGAALAEKFGRNGLFKLVVGDSGQQLAQGWQDLQRRLAQPACQFGIIAGGKGGDSGRNPILPGDDDLVVRVAETRLPGARDFVVLPVTHTFMMNDPVVQLYTLRFMRRGHFVSDEKRQPIPAGEGNVGHDRGTQGKATPDD